MHTIPAALCWFRRDLRLHDHAALYHALRAYPRVYCVFVFDTEILDALAHKTDRRVEFIWHSVVELKAELEAVGGGLTVIQGSARYLLPELARRLGVEAVFINHDYEPTAVARDQQVAAQLRASGIGFHTCKDQVIFEKDELLTQSGRPYTIFTPYKKAWLEKLSRFYLASYPVEKYQQHLAAIKPAAAMPTLEELGFNTTNLLQLGILPGSSGARKSFADFQQRISHYREARNYPALKGVSYLSVHNRFGTLSIREIARFAHDTNGGETWLSELCWRDFYFAILHHFPYVVGHAFRREFEHLSFENSHEKFAAWCEARTGYPIVDAALRQLNQTGYMHNRLRMIVASFLTKDLHIDWRWGEGYFADNLNDFDLAANNGGWQWAASTGCDAQPYFRIFNPVLQSQKFDAEGKFIRRYLPELKGVDNKFIHEPWKMSAAQQQASGLIIGKDYPVPIVDHAAARQISLQIYKTVKNVIAQV